MESFSSRAGSQASVLAGSALPVPDVNQVAEYLMLQACVRASSFQKFDSILDTPRVKCVFGVGAESSAHRVSDLVFCWRSIVHGSKGGPIERSVGLYELMLSHKYGPDNAVPSSLLASSHRDRSTKLRMSAAESASSDRVLGCLQIEHPGDFPARTKTTATSTTVTFHYLDQAFPHEYYYMQADREYGVPCR